MSLFRRRSKSPAPAPTHDIAPVDACLRYHARSKHDFGRYAASLGFLDWANQPDPFRRYDGAPRLALGLPRNGASDASSPSSPNQAAPHSSPPLDALLTPGSVAPRTLDTTSLSHFLFHALALSAGKRIETSSWSLRVNPSSGNLHPTEGWLILPALEGASTDARLPAALHHYAPHAHALERRAVLAPEFGSALFASLPDGAFLVALSSIAWREAWKYGERAYRYVNHDVGHALGALRYAAALCGWTLTRVPPISTARLGELLALDLDDDGPEAEMPDLLAIVRPADSAPPALDWTPPSGAPHSEVLGTPNTLSAEHHDWPIVAAMERLCRDDGSPVATAANTEASGADIGDLQPSPSSQPGAPRTDSHAAPTSQPDARPPRPPHPLLTTPLRPALATTLIRARRSAVAMDGSTRLSAADFFRMLAATHPALAPAPFDALAAPPRVHLFLFVHRVDDVEPGLYFLPRHEGALTSFREASAAPFTFDSPPGCPDDLPLVRLHVHDARSAAARVSCGQDIAGDGCFSLGMLAEFEPVLRAEGPRAYPHLYWETGLIGQILYLQAHAAGVSATGIGCFFDDPVHALAGLRDARFQSLYHFTVGGAVNDPRLVDEDPYAHLGR